jgi:CheY-like chemotaxis protein
MLAGVESSPVLLVEDNPTDVYVIRRILEESHLNLRIDIVRDGQEALRYFDNLARDESSPCPAVVLLDLNIPKVDGFEVLRKIRSTSRCVRTPVIIVTSSNAQEDRNTAEQLKADAYFKKPADLRAYMELGRLVRGLLRPG